MRLVLLTLLSFAAMPPAGPASPPLAGRWTGIFHGGRGDQTVTLVCRPHSGGTLDGLFYLDGDLMGPLTSGTFSTDSLRFNVTNLRVLAKREGTRMTVHMVVAHGKTHDLDLSFADADTSDLVKSPAAAAEARDRLSVDWNQVPDSVLVVHRIPSNESPGPSPALQSGTLFLVGGGPSQDDLNAEFVRLAGGADARIVVIPAAAVDPGKDAEARSRADDWARSLGVSHVEVLQASSREEADSEAFVEPLRRATGAWLPGGEAGRILTRYLGTRTEREVIALLARGGVVGGTSAGALVWGSECQIFRAPADGSPFHVGNAENLLIGDPHSICFGVLRNVVVVPHFTEFRMSASLEKSVTGRPHLLGIGIDEATALEIHGSIARVLGRGKATIFDSRHQAGSAAVLGAGSRYDLSRQAAI